MNRIAQLLVWYTLFSPAGISQAQERVFQIGYLNHPRIITFYKPIIEEAYKRMGITTVFIEVGGERGLRLLDDGVMDADVIRFESVTRPFVHVYPIYPQLAKGRTSLYCSKDVPCTLDVLSDPNAAIAVRRRFKERLKENNGMPNVYAQLETFEDMDKIRQLLLHQRYHYAVLPSDDTVDPEFHAIGIQSVLLEAHPAVHVIHERHAHIASALSIAIEAVVEEHNARHAHETVTNQPTVSTFRTLVK